MLLQILAIDIHDYNDEYQVMQISTWYVALGHRGDDQKGCLVDSGRQICYTDREYSPFCAATIVTPHLRRVIDLTDLLRAEGAGG
jgi:hypothetical protein